MATILTSDADVTLFVPGDVYRYDIDNRPLRILIANDEALNTELEATTAEVVQARTGLYSTYATLDARLDDLEVGAGLPQKQMLFAEYKDISERHAALYASGCVTPLTEVFYISDLSNSGRFGFPHSDANYGASPFGQVLLHDETAATYANQVSLGDGFDPIYNSGTGVYSFGHYVPISIFVNGMLVKLFNEQGGTGGGTGPANEVTWLLGAAPSVSPRVDLLWLEVYIQNVARQSPSFYAYGAVGSKASAITDPTDVTLPGTVGFYGGNGGDYFQVRHRLRVSEGVNPDTYQFGMNDPAVLAQGSKNTPVAGYVFRSGTKASSADPGQRDPGLWIAGAGDSTSKTALGTIDGYVYAIPVALVFRRSQGQWTHTNQNGSRTSAGAGTWATNDSDRPDGFFHDKVERDDIVLLAPASISGKTDLKRVLDESFDRLLRGKLNTRHGYLRYDAQYEENNYDSAAEGPAGAINLSVNAISAGAETHTDQFKDEVPDGSLPLAAPDGFRRTFGSQPETQPVGFSFNLNSSVWLPANFVTSNGSILTFKAIGQSFGDTGATIAEPPVMWWAGSYKPVAVSGGTWTGLGTGTVTATLNAGDTNYNATGTVIGFIKVIFTGTFFGYKKPNIATVGQKYIAPSLAETTAASLTYCGVDRLVEPSGVFVTATNLYVADWHSHKLWKLDITTKAVVASFGIYGTPLNDNTHLHNPSGITVDATGNVYVCDSGNQRVVKLNSSLGYVSQFGATGVTGVGTAHLNTPMGVSVDGAGSLYISDLLNARVVKTDGSLTWVSQFGIDGVSISDNTHCVGPRGSWFGPDNKLYVADTTRILVLGNDMSLSMIFQPGAGLPVGTSASIASVEPYPIVLMKEDAAGNKYVFQFAGDVSPNGQILTKYNSSWVYQCRRGAAWDAGGAKHGGLGAGTHEGLIYGQSVIMDEANGVLIVFEANSSGTGMNASNNVVSDTQNRVLVINMSDLSMNAAGVKYSVVRGGVRRPYGPYFGNRSTDLTTNPNGPVYTTLPSGLEWPSWAPTATAIDTSNGYAYIASGQGNPKMLVGMLTRTDWCQVEKWATHGSPDPDNWTLVIQFGKLGLNWNGGQYEFDAWSPGYAGWDATSLNNISPQGMCMDILIGPGTTSSLFIAENNRVVKLNISGSGMTSPTWFGQAGVAGNDNHTLSMLAADTYLFYGMLKVVGTDNSDSNARVYVQDQNNKRIMILKPNVSWDQSGSVAAYSNQFTNPHFQLGLIFEPLGHSHDGNKLWVRTWGDPGIPEPCSYELNITSRDAPIFIQPGLAGIVTVYYPSNLSPLPAGVGTLISGVAGADGVLYCSDYGVNQLVAINNADFRFIGEAGTSGLSQTDNGNWNGPYSLAVQSDILYLADFRGSRVFTSNVHVAHVQPNVGRVEFLAAPEATSKWFGYSKYSAYQGVYRRYRPWLAADVNNWATFYPPISGRAVLTAPEKILVTTLGKGSIEFLKNPGVIPYANCVGRLPIPVGHPDERGVVPADFILSGQPIAAASHYLLPVLNTASAHFGQFPGENESFWEKDTQLMTQTFWGNPTGLRGGVSAWFAEADFIPKPLTSLSPRVSTFSCQNAPGFRYLVVPFLVVIEGEVLLAVRVQGISSGSLENTVGDSTYNVTELYRPIGHPMLKNNGESDYTLTVI
jgi:hypothetical protein